MPKNNKNLSEDKANDTTTTSSTETKTGNGTESTTKDQEPEVDKKEGNGQQTKRQQVEAHLRKQFQFRVNEITGGVEYTHFGQNKYVELTDYLLNSLCRQIDAKRGISVTPGTLLEYLKSDFVPNYHPFKAHFELLLKELPNQSGTATIDQLATTIVVQKPDLFQVALTRWLVATVANVFEEGCQNQTCLVLTGDQGGFKTTWLNLLCPTALEKYRFCGKIDLQSKDTYILLATQLIINLDDQLRELNKKDSETVKTLISHGNLTVRRPYDKIASYLTRTASFCGSINASDFLTDPTGSRRFLPFEVSTIDINRAQCLDFRLVWAEAYALYKAGFQYWFTKQETDEMFENNEEFQVTTPEHELIHEYYQVVGQDSQANVRLTTTALLSSLQNYTRIPLSPKKIGEALRKSNAIKKTSRSNGGGKVWFLYERSVLERDILKQASSAS